MSIPVLFSIKTSRNGRLVPIWWVHLMFGWKLLASFNIALLLSNDSLEVKKISSIRDSGSSPIRLLPKSLLEFRQLDCELDSHIFYVNIVSWQLAKIHCTFAITFTLFSFQPGIISVQTLFLFILFRFLHFLFTPRILL